MNFHPRNFRKKFKSFEFGILFWKTNNAGRKEKMERDKMGVLGKGTYGSRR